MAVGYDSAELGGVSCMTWWGIDRRIHPPPLFSSSRQGMRVTTVPDSSSTASIGFPMDCNALSISVSCVFPACSSLLSSLLVVFLLLLDATALLRRCTGLLFLKTPSTKVSAYKGSSLQKPPFPGSSFVRGILMKHLFRERLCRMEF